MANIIIYPSKATPHKIIKYVDNPKKTTPELISNQNLDDSRSVARQMMETQDIYQCRGERKYYDIVQSFEAGEVTPEKAHELGEELAKKYFAGYEVHIATHTNTDNLHNHIIVNSVSLDTGRKWDNTKADTKELKELSNEICRRENLSTINLEKRAEDSITHGEYWTVMEGRQSPVFDCRLAVCDAMNKSKDWEELRDILHEKGVELKVQNKNVSFLPPDRKQYIRGNTLGQYYTKENIQDRLNRNLNRELEREYDKAIERQQQQIIEQPTMCRAPVQKIGSLFSSDPSGLQFTEMKGSIENELSRNIERATTAIETEVGTGNDSIRELGNTNSDRGPERNAPNDVRKDHEADRTDNRELRGRDGQSTGIREREHGRNDGDSRELSKEQRTVKRDDGERENEYRHGITH